ncbi:hypothetical protein [Fodinicola acaciae]|uniref:hypothetical protein n=1 Tax=Fodinicola acaciae TaxID=2681555 RepID=UPI0013D2163E|nr:hypothetical protein [Fodinicola acaciae]
MTDFCRVNGVLPVAIAIVVAVLGGVLGLSLGAYAGWHTAPRLPAPTVTDQAVAAAFPGAGIGRYGGTDYPYPFGFGTDCDGGGPVWCFVFGGDLGFDAENRVYGKDVPETSAAALIAAAATRLRGDGWQVVRKTDLQPAFYGYQAGKGELVMHIVASIRTGANRFVNVWFEADRRDDPPLLATMTVTGLLAGAVAGWQVAAWVLRSRPRLSRNGRILTAIGFCYVIALLLPGVVETVSLLGKIVFAHEPNLPVYRPFVAGWGRPGAILTAPFAAVILLVTALAARKREVSSTYAGRADHA